MILYDVKVLTVYYNADDDDEQVFLIFALNLVKSLFLDFWSVVI